MSYRKKFFLSILLSLAILNLSVSSKTASALSYDPFSFIILTQYKAAVDIGDEFYIFAFTSNGKQASWKSSNTRVASVNTYGKVTAKKAGTATITAKIKNAEASCRVTVKKTKITLNMHTASIERGETLTLSATTSNHSEVTWKSSKRSIATIDDYGNITGLKPGETVITAKADGSSVTCMLTVKTPSIQLNKTNVTLYRGQTVQLSASVSSKINPTWKSNKKSVAVVTSDGLVTAKKNGTATITATLDGVSVSCEIIVLKPAITLSSTELIVKKGSNTTLTAVVSSNNKPVWSSSNSNIVSVNSEGVITALKKGTAYIYAAEDGTKVRCTVKVTD